MSALITSCLNCFEPQVLDPREVTLHVATNGAGRYVTACTACGVVLSRPIAGRSLELMIEGGVRPIDPRDEPSPAKPPLTLDDLLDLHQLLSTSTWFANLVTEEPAE